MKFFVFGFGLGIQTFAGFGCMDLGGKCGIDGFEIDLEEESDLMSAASALEARLGWWSREGDLAGLGGLGEGFSGSCGIWAEIRERRGWD